MAKVVGDIPEVKQAADIGSQIVLARAVSGNMLHYLATMPTK